MIFKINNSYEYTNIPRENTILVSSKSFANTFSCQELSPDPFSPSGKSGSITAHGEIGASAPELPVSFTASADIDPINPSIHGAYTGRLGLGYGVYGATGPGFNGTLASSPISQLWNYPNHNFLPPSER